VIEAAECDGPNATPWIIRGPVVKQPKKFTIGVLDRASGSPAALSGTLRGAQNGGSVTIEARYLPGRIASVAKKFSSWCFTSSIGQRANKLSR